MSNSILRDKAKEFAKNIVFLCRNISNILAAQKIGIDSILFNRYNEQYTGEKVHSFEELDITLTHL